MAITNLLSISIYIIVAFIVSQIRLVWLAIYLFYILILEVRVLKTSCVDCYYFGKVCASGKGKLASLFFRRGMRKDSWNER